MPRDPFGHVKIDQVNPGEWFAKQFAARLGAEKVLVQKSGYFARSAPADETDLLLIKSMTDYAVGCALRGISGVVGHDEENGDQLRAIEFDRIRGGKKYDLTDPSYVDLLRPDRPAGDRGRSGPDAPRLRGPCPARTILTGDSRRADTAGWPGERTAPRRPRLPSSALSAADLPDILDIDAVRLRSGPAAGLPGRGRSLPWLELDRFIGARDPAAGNELVAIGCILSKQMTFPGGPVHAGRRRLLDRRSVRAGGAAGLLRGLMTAQLHGLARDRRRDRRHPDRQRGRVCTAGSATARRSIVS